MIFIYRLYLKTVVLCSLVLCSISVYGQKQIVGFVCDEEDSSPISNATIIQYQDSTLRKILFYAITDKQGFFLIKNDFYKGNRIVVRRIGYSELLMDNTFGNDTLRLRMAKASIKLDEVTVRGRYSGVSIKGDSIIFDIGHFTRGSEENVSDILNSLPGVSVSETGKASYAGRDINKVLVNGQEMMDVGSGIMINGLGADIVSGVQVVNNWKDGSIRGDFDDRNMTVLNIDTKAKTRIVGSVEGSYGVTSKYELKPTLMVTGKKFSLTAAGSSNNYGSEVFSIEEYMSSFVDLSSILSDGMGRLELSETERLMLTPPKNVNQNSNSAIVVNGLYKPTETLTVKGSVIYDNSKLKSLEKNSNYYYMSGLSSFETDSQETTNDMLSANVSVRWKPSSAIELTSITLGSYNNYGKSNIINVANNLNACQNQKQTKKQISETVAANFKVGNCGMLFTNVSFVANSMRNYFNILSDSMLLRINHTYDSDYFVYNTYKDFPSQSFSSEFGYGQKFKNDYQLRLSVAYERETDNINIYGASDAPVKDDYNTSKYIVATKLSKRSGVLRYYIDNRIIWTHCEYAGYIRKTKAEWCPTLMLNLVFSPKQELRLLGQHSVSAVPAERFINCEMPLGYNSYRTTSLTESPFSTKNQFFMHYRILEQYHKFLLFANCHYSCEKGNGIDIVRQDGILSSHTYADGGNTKNLFCSLTVRKGIGNLPIDLQLYTGLNISQLPFIMNNSHSDYKMQLCTNSLTLSTHFVSAINAEIKGIYEKGETTTSGYKTKTDEYSVSCKLLFAKNKWKGELRYSYDAVDGDFAYHFNHDIGFRVSYNLSHLYFKLSGNNLLHIRRYEWAETTTSTTYKSETQYLRMPGYCLVTMGWRL